MYEIISTVAGTLGFLCLCYCGWACKAHAERKAAMKMALEDGRISKEKYDAFLRTYRFADTLRDPKFVFRTVTRIPNT
jgi:hypothetical protein